MTKLKEIRNKLFTRFSFISKGPWKKSLYSEASLAGEEITADLFQGPFPAQVGVYSSEELPGKIENIETSQKNNGELKIVTKGEDFLSQAKDKVPPVGDIKIICKSIEEEIDNSFAGIYSRSTGDSWGVLIRNAKDGGANSVLAAKILKKTVQSLESANISVADMLESTKDVSNVISELEQLSADIHELSGQSKIVSINAFIEAARAGEQGKTFSVVANELGSLSDNIKKLTIKIHKSLKSIDEKVDANTKLCYSVADIFASVDEELKQFNKIMMRIEDLSLSQSKSFEVFENEMNRQVKTQIKTASLIKKRFLSEMKEI